MNVNELKELCINGASQYLAYLTEKKKGRPPIRIHKISPVAQTNHIFKIELSDKLFDLDSIFFLHTPSGTEFDTSVIKVQEYDYDRNLLFIQTPENLAINFSKVTTQDLVIISDLKFLVKRLHEFYKINGHRLRLPESATYLGKKLTDFEFLPEHIPDKDQENALLSIFKNPIVYVWGAPGTGKTRFVVSYAAIEYIKKNKRIAIFAPTNVALEQVLSGVISITDSAGINRDKILRIGNPSRNFAAAYPEVCEVSGIQKKLKEIDKQILIIERILGIDSYSKNESILLNLDSLVDQICETKQQSITAAKSLTPLNNNLQYIDDNIELEKRQLSIVTNSIDRQESKLTSLSHRFLKALYSKKSNLELRITELYAQHKKHQERIIQLEREFNQLNNQKLDLTKKVFQLDTILKSLLKELYSLSFTIPEAQSALKLITPENAREKFTEIKMLVSNGQGDSNINNELKLEYSSDSHESLRNKLSHLSEQREALLKLDTEKRVQNVNIVAATFDSFIGRFPEADIKLDHIFIDEAGYANIIKALTSFVYGVPVTFLGDHYQLPPVSELNDYKTSEEMSDCIVWQQSAIYSCNVFEASKKELIEDYQFGRSKISDSVARMNLLKTYRFGSNLAKVLDDYVYHNGFHSDAKKGKTKIRYIHAKKVPPQSKRDNQSELNQIKRFLSLIDPKLIVSNDSLAIISPYNDQVTLLGQTFTDLRRDQRVLTVHKSQGREWDLVIFSVSDTFNMHFTNSQNKQSRGLNLLNTAVSRARKDLVIVCDYEFWIDQKGQFIQGLLSVAEEIKI